MNIPQDSEGANQTAQSAADSLADLISRAVYIEKYGEPPLEHAKAKDEALKQLYDLCVAEAKTYTTYRNYLETVVTAVPVEALARVFNQPVKSLKGDGDG